MKVQVGCHIAESVHDHQQRVGRSTQVFTNLCMITPKEKGEWIMIHVKPMGRE
jgi:hypothetical protein